jgi:hypothetical protein
MVQLLGADFPANLLLQFYQESTNEFLRILFLFYEFHWLGYLMLLLSRLNRLINDNF